MICVNLMTHKLEMIKWYFIIFIDDSEFWKNKIVTLDMFNFYNENWNLCWIEYPSLRTKILIKKFLRKDNPTCLIFELRDCLNYIWILDPKRVELTSRTYECIFIGYVINIEAYMFCDINVKVIIELKDANFYEISTSLKKE